MKKRVRESSQETTAAKFGESGKAGAGGEQARRKNVVIIHKCGQKKQQGEKSGGFDDKMKKGSKEICFVPRALRAPGKWPQVHHCQSFDNHHRQSFDVRVTLKPLTLSHKTAGLGKAATLAADIEEYRT
ncbi:hypothetical protein EJ110_NYTH13801 [Nymphaea thermarum]|nr:hypothetical protein EJ110_NYTH13801 [Nymphaea thermarum]